MTEIVGIRQTQHMHRKIKIDFEAMRRKIKATDEFIKEARADLLKRQVHGRKLDSQIRRNAEENIRSEKHWRELERKGAIAMKDTRELLRHIEKIRKTKGDRR